METTDNQKKNLGLHSKSKSIQFLNQKANFNRTSNNDLESLLSYVKSNTKHGDSDSKPKQQDFSLKKSLKSVISSSVLN